jgi:hypothetical protein
MLTPEAPFVARSILFGCLTFLPQERHMAILRCNMLKSRRMCSGLTLSTSCMPVKAARLQAGEERWTDGQMDIHRAEWEP